MVTSDLQFKWLIPLTQEWREGEVIGSKPTAECVTYQLKEKKKGETDDQHNLNEII